MGGGGEGGGGGGGEEIPLSPGSATKNKVSGSAIFCTQIFLHKRRTIEKDVQRNGIEKRHFLHSQLASFLVFEKCIVKKIFRICQNIMVNGVFQGGEGFVFQHGVRNNDITSWNPRNERQEYAIITIM